MKKKSLLAVTFLLFLVIGAVSYVVYQKTQQEEQGAEKTVNEMIQAVDYANELKFTYEYNRLTLVKDIQNKPDLFESYLFVEKEDTQKRAENILVFHATDKTAIIVNNLNYYLKKFPENGTEKYSEAAPVTLEHVINDRAGVQEVLNNFSQAQLNLILDPAKKL